MDHLLTATPLMLVNDSDQAGAPPPSGPGDDAGRVLEHRADVAEHVRAELAVHDAVVERQRERASPCDLDLALVHPGLSLI